MPRSLLICVLVVSTLASCAPHTSTRRRLAVAWVTAAAVVAASAAYASTQPDDREGAAELGILLARPVLLLATLALPFSALLPRASKERPRRMPVAGQASLDIAGGLSIVSVRFAHRCEDHLCEDPGALGWAVSTGLGYYVHPRVALELRSRLVRETDDSVGALGAFARYAGLGAKLELGRGISLAFTLGVEHVDTFADERTESAHLIGPATGVRLAYRFASGETISLETSPLLTKQVEGPGLHFLDLAVMYGFQLGGPE